MRVLSVIAVVVFAVSACGSDSPEAAEPDRSESADPSARDVIAASLQASADSDSNALQYSSDEADCVADAIVAGITTDRLEELGLDVAEQTAPELDQPPLTAEEGDVVYGAIEECIDLVAYLGAVFAADGSLDDESAECVATEYIASGLLREAMLDQAFDQALNDRIDATIAEAFDTCTT